MADIDVDPFGEHDKTDETTDETFPLTPRGGSMDVVTHEASGEQETSFGGKSHESEEERVKKLYQLLGNKIQQRLEPRLDLFELGEDG